MSDPEFHADLFLADLDNKIDTLFQGVKTFMSIICTFIVRIDEIRYMYLRIVLFEYPENSHSQTVLSL